MIILIMVDWTPANTFKFIEIYKKEEVIWNPQRRDHKNKNMVNDAWQRIAGKMEIPVSELKKKKDALMAAFRANHTKVVASKRSGVGEGEIFRPIWAFYDALASFMKNVYTSKSILCTETEQCSDFHETVELQECREHMNTALITLNKVLSSSNSKNPPEDDCDLYAKLLATRLRAFSKVERQAIMYEINGLLLTKGYPYPVSLSPTIFTRPTPPRSSSRETIYSRSPPIYISPSTEHGPARPPITTPEDYVDENLDESETIIL